MARSNGRENKTYLADLRNTLLKLFEQIHQNKHSQQAARSEEAQQIAVARRSLVSQALLIMANTDLRVVTIERKGVRAELVEALAMMRSSNGPEHGLAETVLRHYTSLQESVTASKQAPIQRAAGAVC